MRIFYLNLLYFFIFLALVRLKYLEVGDSASDIPTYILLLIFLGYFLLSLVNVYFHRRKRKLALKIRLGFYPKYQGKVIINMGTVSILLVSLIYLLPGAATVPLLIAIFLSSAIGLGVYHNKKDHMHRLPALLILIICVMAALFLTPANPIYAMGAAFAISIAVLIFSNLIIRYKKIPFYVGESKLFHAITILLIIVSLL